MEGKFLKFMKQRFREPGAHCPMHDWKVFIANEFSREVRDLAIAFTQKLIESKYIEVAKKGNEEYIVISGYGAEMLKRNKLEVDV